MWVDGAFGNEDGIGGRYHWKYRAPLDRATAGLVQARAHVPARCMSYSRIGDLVELARIRRLLSIGDVVGNLLNIGLVGVFFAKL